MKKIVSGKAEVSMLTDLILKIDFLEKADITLDDSKEIIKVAMEVSKNERHANLVDMRKMSFVNSAARRNFALQDRSSLVAIAVIINSKTQRGFSNLYLTINQPVVPTKMFTDESEAIEWLNSKLEED